MKHDNITLIISQDKKIVLDQKSIITIRTIQSGDNTHISITNSNGDTFSVAAYSDSETAASEVDRYIDETIKGTPFGEKFFMFI